MFKSFFYFIEYFNIYLPSINLIKINQMKCKITGTIKFIGEREERSEGFYKRGVIINGKGAEDEESQDYYFESLKDKSDNIAKYQKVGDKVEATFYINCRQYGTEGKYFTSLSLTYVDSLESASSSSSPSSQPSSKIEPIAQDDDLPF